MDSPLNIFSNYTTSTLTRKFSQTQRSPKKDPISPIHIVGMSDKYNSIDGSSCIPPGFCTTPRLKKTNSTKHIAPIEGSMPKLGHILRELYDTEIEYVKVLETTVNVYFAALDNERVVDPKKIFGNIRDILKFHKNTFLPQLEEVYHSAEEVAALLNQSYKEFMQLYVRYCLMICESSQLLKLKYFKIFFKNLSESLKDKQTLSDYLIRPVQRITRYELILNQMMHTYQKAGLGCENIERTYACIKEVPTLADNAMKLNSILDYYEKFNVKHLRRLRLHDKFIVSDRDKRFSHKRFYVFLMVDRIIFTKICSDNYSITELLCTFKSELLFDEDQVSVKPEKASDKDHRVFVLLKGKKEISMQAEKLEIRDRWITQINELLIQRSHVNSDSGHIPTESPIFYDESYTGTDNLSSNTDDEFSADVNSDVVDLKQYCVIEDFNPDETMNGFIALRTGQIYEVGYKLLSHWHVVLVGHISPDSSEYWSGFEGFVYPQFLQLVTTDNTNSPDKSISPEPNNFDPETLPLGYQSLPIEQERNISSKVDTVKLDNLIESENLYSPLVPKRAYNKAGASKLSSSLTRKLQMTKHARSMPDRQSITEEDYVSGSESARSSVSISESRDMYYSISSDMEYEPTIEPESTDLYNVFIKSNSITEHTMDTELNFPTPIVSTTAVNLPTLNTSRDLDNSQLYNKYNRDSFGHIGEQVLLKYGSREELNADIPPDGSEEIPVHDDPKNFPKTTDLSPHHKSDSIPADLNTLDRDCEGSSPTKTAEMTPSDKLTSRPYAPLKRSSSDQLKKVFTTQLVDRKYSNIEMKSESQDANDDAEPVYRRRRSNSIHKIIERFNSCSSDTSPRKSSQSKRHSLFVTDEQSFEEDDAYKTLTPSAGKIKLSRALSFDREAILSISDLNTNEIVSTDRAGSTETLKNPIFCDQKSPVREANPVIQTERKSTQNESHTLKITTTTNRTRSISPEPYRLPIKITTKKVVSVPLPPAIKPKPKVNVKSTVSNAIMGNFEISNFNQIFEENSIKGKRRKNAIPPPVLPKNRNLIGEFKIPVVSKPLQNLSVSLGRLVDISFEVEAEIENMQVDWYKDSLSVSSRRFTTSINGCICSLKIWEFSELDQSTYKAIIKTRGGHASTKCDVKLASK